MAPKNAITVINSFEAFHQLYQFPQMQEVGCPLLTEDLIAEQLLYIYNRSKHVVLSNDIRVVLCEAGFKLLATDSVLRSWINGEIIYEEETRDDKERYIKATRLVREVYEEMEQYTGDISSMRLYEVKC